MYISILYMKLTWELWIGVPSIQITKTLFHLNALGQEREIYLWTSIPSPSIYLSMGHKLWQPNREMALLEIGRLKVMSSHVEQAVRDNTETRLLNGERNFMVRGRATTWFEHKSAGWMNSVLQRQPTKHKINNLHRSLIKQHITNLYRWLSEQ